MRNKHWVIYTSSYDRGLEHLLKIWPDVKKEVKDAELHIFYGWELFERVYRDNPASMAWMERMNKMMEADGVVHHGRVSQTEMEKWIKKCGVWAYPTHFGEISCHPAGTRITTTRGEVEIENINIEDRVLTHTGSFKPIEKIMKRDAEENMYKLEVHSGDTLELTGEHPLYVIRGKSSWRSFEDIKDVSPEWIEARDTKENDCLLFPIYKEMPSPYFSIPYPHRKNNLLTEDNNVPETINTSPELGWWLGYFCGDGNASTRTGKVSVLVSDRHPEHLYPALEGFKLFGVVPKQKKLRGCTEHYIHSYRLARTLRERCYDGKKKVLPPQAMNKHGFEGLMAADGNDNGRTKSFTNTSLRLIGQMRELLTLYGETGKVKKRSHKSGVTSYTISWTPNPAQKFYGVSDKYIFRRIKSVSKRPFKGSVYNLEVKTDNSYVSNGHVVHNCISAMKAQAWGAVPVVVDYAALQTTVNWGVKVQGDIYDPETRESFKKGLIEALTSEQTDEMRNPMMAWARNKFKWEKVAIEWSREFKHDELVEAADVLIKKDKKAGVYLPVQLQKKLGMEQTI